MNKDIQNQGQDVRPDDERKMYFDTGPYYNNIYKYIYKWSNHSIPYHPRPIVK